MKLSKVLRVAGTIFLFGIFCSANVQSQLFDEADVGINGTFTLFYSSTNNQRAKAVISVRNPKLNDTSKPIGNYNFLVKLNLFINDASISIPKECRFKLFDINYIRLEDKEGRFQFWIQGGDGSEAYQVAFTFAKTQSTKCRFLPDEGVSYIEPMHSQKIRDAYSKIIKK